MKIIWDYIYFLGEEQTFDQVSTNLWWAEVAITEEQEKNALVICNYKIVFNCILKHFIVK